MPTIDGDHLRGHLETLVLAILERGQAHGREIIQRLEERGCGLLKLKEGSLYPALHRMEKMGLIKARWEESTRGRRGARRRIYCITPKGARTLRQERDQWQSFVSVIGGIIAVPG